MIGKHNALDPVNECGKPLIEVSVNVFAAPLVKLPGGMLKVSLELVELAPALAHLHLKCTSGDGNKETEHHSNDLRDCRDHAVGSGSYNYQRRDGRGADHDEPAGEVKRLLRPAADTVGYQYTLAPLEAQVVLSFRMIRPLIDQRRRQPVDPTPPRAATPLLPSAKEPITHAHSMTYLRPGTRRQRSGRYGLGGEAATATPARHPAPGTHLLVPRGATVFARPVGIRRRAARWSVPVRRLRRTGYPGRSRWVAGVRLGFPGSITAGLPRSRLEAG